MTTGTLPELLEKDFATQVEDLFNMFGWTWQHQRPARTKYGWSTAIRGRRGFPDYCAARKKDGICQVILAEIKDEKGKPTPDQQHWLDVTGGYLWRPSMIEEIMRILK
jgi:hypothetical protein